MGVNVNSMTDVTNVFLVTGVGTGAKIHDLVVADNVMENRWTVINVMEEAEATANDISVFNSTSLRHVFTAAAQSKLTLDKIEVADLMGGRIINPQDVSSIVFGNSGATMLVDRLQVDSVSMFTVSIPRQGAWFVISQWATCVGCILRERRQQYGNYPFLR
jgi:hypothetical protein